MSGWKPVGETWGKRKGRRYPVSGSAWWMPGRVYKAPVGTDPDDPTAWEEIGKTDGFEVETFGPGALYDSVVFRRRGTLTGQLPAEHKTAAGTTCHVALCSHQPGGSGYCLWHERPHT